LLVLIREAENFETQHYETAWLIISFSKPNDAIRQAQERINTQGWAYMRDALSSCVRYVHFYSRHVSIAVYLNKSIYIIRTILTGSKLGLNKFPATILPSVVDFLELAGSTWRDVPINVKGAIFDPSFLRAVRSLYLEFAMKVRSFLLLEADPLQTDINTYLRLVFRMLVKTLNSL
jgi:hypothetical protein